jgi:hypothetical protein
MPVHETLERAFVPSMRTLDKAEGGFGIVRHDAADCSRVSPLSVRFSADQVFHMGGGVVRDCAKVQPLSGGKRASGVETGGVRSGYAVPRQ